MQSLFQLAAVVVIYNKDDFLMFVTCAGPTLWQMKFNSCTGRSKEAHLQVSAPWPGTTSPAASVSTPTQVLASHANKNANYFYGQIPRENYVTRPMSEISCLSRAEAVCTEELYWAVLLHEAALNHLLGFNILFPCCGIIFFQRKM